MQRVELDMLALAAASRHLAGQIARNFLPNAIVFIDRAGFLVAQPISRHFGIPLVAASPSRAGGHLKQLATPMLSHLPPFLHYGLRQIELRLRVARGGKLRRVLLPKETALAGNILVVDDSVDTGSTLFSVCQALRQRAGACHIRTAALNCWQNSTALIKTDYALYHNTFLTTPMSRDSREYPAFLRLYQTQWATAASTRTEPSL